MGLRIALGATRPQVSRLAVRQGVGPVASGIALGMVLGTLLRGLILTALPSSGLSLVDWWALAAIPLPVLFVAAIACYLPARSASRVDPNVALRDS